MIVERAEKTIRKLKGVIDVRTLSKEDKETLLDIELAKRSDIIPVVNEGIKVCLRNEYCLCILKNKEFRNPPAPTVLLVTDKGRLLGQELVSPEDKKKFQGREDVFFISDDFVLFPSKISSSKDETYKEKEIFLLPPVPFPELEVVDGICDVISASPSPWGDIYLRKKYGWPDDPKFATILVGFSQKKYES